MRVIGNWSWSKMRKLITQLIRGYKTFRLIFLVIHYNDTMPLYSEYLILKVRTSISYIRVGAASFMNMTAKDSF